MQSLFNLIEHTHRNVFLTGKAGTGKTTFLGDFTKRTKKKFVVVAPTGIAAINAGGVTIHSMFGLPLKTHVPVVEEVDPNEAINIPHLLPHFKYRREKLKLLRNLDILIIDEVSMLRCDVLDMMDLALRTARRSTQKFGGVQLLLIGDLYQLPPVVKEGAERILYRYYNSPFFFDAMALKDKNLLTVELKKVYRQTDAVFLQMLNAIRDKDFDAINFELLNARYDPQFEPGDNYVYLTSHNYMADNINRRNLANIKEKQVSYRAIISGDFNTHLYPNDEKLDLKTGAQVMFIRNDTSEAKRYFNGKLAKVTELGKDHIKVLPDGEDEELQIERELWENKKYYVNTAKEIKEDVVGSYEQFPLKLAWAVTIHKSQGLTFDRVIIDAGRSFTSGQVYVALSRCRTLEGIILKSMITPNTILTDERINSFHSQTNAGERIEAILVDEKYAYAIEKLLARLDITWLKKELKGWADASAESRFLNNDATEQLAETMQNRIINLITVYEKFAAYARAKVKIPDEAGWHQVQEKSAGAVNYFFDEILTHFFEPLKKSYTETKGQKGLKGYNDVLKTLLEELEEYLQSLQQAMLLDKSLYTKRPDDAINIKVEKKPSHLISFELFEAGKDLETIAEERGLSTTTIWGHMAQMAAVGVVEMKKLFTEEKLTVFQNLFAQSSFETINQWKNALPDDFDFAEIRVLVNHFRYFKKKRVSMIQVILVFDHQLAAQAGYC